MTGQDSGSGWTPTGPPPDWMSYDVLLHNRCGRKLSEHPLPHAPEASCPFPARPPVEFRQAPPAPDADRERLRDEILDALARHPAVPFGAHAAVADAVLTLPAVAALTADAEKGRRAEALFSDGGPDTLCRTVYRAGGAGSIECVEVPLADLRRALDGGDTT